MNTNGSANGNGAAVNIEDRIIGKIKRVQTSPVLYHVAGRVMGHELAEVEGDDGSGIVITSDGWAQIGGNVFLGAAEALRGNLEGLIAAAGLTEAEAVRFWARYAACVRDMRPAEGSGQ